MAGCWAVPHERHHARTRSRRRADARVEITRIGLLSNGKVAVAPLFDHLESLLRREWKAKEVRRLTKGNYSAPAEPALIRELARCHLIFTGVGD